MTLTMALNTYLFVIFVVFLNLLMSKRLYKARLLTVLKFIRIWY